MTKKALHPLLWRTGWRESAVRCVIAISFVATVLFAVTPAAAGRQLLHGHVPAVTTRLQPMGQLPATNDLSLTIGLPLRNREALTNLLREIYDPASPSYHHYLTPEQFADQFGPTEQDYQAVIAFAKAKGLTIRGTHPNRMLVDVRGPVAEVEHALHVAMRVYQHPKENRSFFAPDVEPSLDVSVPVLTISGLSDYIMPQPMNLRRTSANELTAPIPNAGSGSGGNFLGNDFRAAYAPGVALTGAGQSVGLVQFQSGFYTNDILAYETLAGLPNVPVQPVLLDGYGGGAGNDNDEVSLDIEMAISMAPGLSNVIVYEGSSTDDILNRMATDNLAKQLSASWSYPIDATTIQIFQQFAVQGQTFFNSSGDYDAWVGTIYPPCDNPYITIVGGTTLTTSGPGGSWVSEKVWNAGGGAGSGGGISTTYSIPSWQTNVSMVANQGSTTMRNIPDVALTSDKVWVVFGNGSSGSFGGTSCASPLWAGFAALINQQAMASGRPAIGFINPAVYAIGTGPNYSTTFHDTVTGNNTNSSSANKFQAASGYDLCTGWGTPAGQSLINALANPEALQITPSAGFNSSGGVGGPFTVTSLTLSLTNAGTSSLNWSLSNTSLWLNAAPGSGTLTPGGPATAVTVKLNAAASNLVVGSYSASVRFTNLNDSVGQSRQFTLSVVAPPTITLQPTNQAVVEGTAAAFTAGATGGLPLFYQWQDNGTNLTDGGTISGSATRTLIISNVAPVNIGSYSVIVSNIAGVTNSTNALLTLTPSSPVITRQPGNQSVLVGGAALFSVTVIGTTPLAYQWNFNGTNIDGATNSSLTLASVQLTNAGNYAVLVTNVIGSTLSSNGVLTVNLAPPCAPPPSGLVAWWRAEGNALDTAGVNNGTLFGGSSYVSGEVGQAFEFDGSTGNVRVPASPGINVGLNNGFTIELWCNPATTNIGGVGVMTLLEWNNNSGSLSGIGCHVEFYSAGVIVADIVDPSGNDHAIVSGGGYVSPNVWQHLAMTYDKTTGVLTVYRNGTVAVSGNVGIWTPSTAFDLYFGIRSAGIFAPIPYQGGLDEISLYNRVLSQSELQAIYTAGDQGKCYVATPPVITQQPTNQTVAVGGTATFTVAATGTPPLFYQWNFGGTNIFGTTNTVLTLTNAQLNQAGNYAVLVTNIAGSALSSNAVLTVTTAPPFIIIQPPTNQTVVVGNTATFTVLAGGTPPLNYQWVFGLTNIVGATNSVLTLTNVQFTNAGNYTVLVTNAYGSILSSNSVLTVSPPPSCTTPPSGLVAWLRGESNVLDSVGTNNGIAQNTTYTTGEVASAFVVNGSASSFVRVPASASLNVGLSNGFTIELWCKPATTNAGGVGVMTLLEWNNNSGSMSGIGCHLEFFNAGYVDADIVDPSGNDHDILSTGGILTPNAWQHLAMTYDKTTGNLIIYRNGVVVGSGNVGIWTPSTAFDLYFGIRPAGIFAPIPYQGGLDEVSLYSRVLSASEIQAVFNAGNGGKCYVPPPPVIVTQPTNQTAIFGRSAQFTVLASGIAPLTYQWNFNGTNINGATNTTLVLTNVQYVQAGNYAVLVSNPNGSVLSSNAVLTVNPPPPCTPPPSGLVGWWRGEGNAYDSAGPNNGTLAGGMTFAAAEVGQGFVFDGSSGNAKIPASASLNVGLSNGFTVEMWINPANTNNPMSVVEWNNNSGSLSGIGAHMELYDGGRVLCDVVDPSGTDHSLVSRYGLIVPNTLQHLVWTYSKTNGMSVLYCNGVVVTNVNVGVLTPSTAFDLYLGIRPAGIAAPMYFQGMLDEVSTYNRALSASEIFTIYNAGNQGKCYVPTAPVIMTQPANQTVPAAGTAGFSVSAIGTQPLSYQWALNTTNVSGATNSTLALTNVQYAQAGNYSVTVVNSLGTTPSSNALLTVTVDHFTWSVIPSPRYVNTPFAVSIQARDLANGVFTNFTSFANLSSTNGIAVAPPASGNFNQGVWTGSVTVPQVASNLVLRADDGPGHLGLANPIDVVNLPGLGMLRFGSVVLIQWPVVSPAFVLESSAGLSPATWVAVPYVPAQIGGQYLVPLDMTGTNGFYRLRFIGP